MHPDQPPLGSQRSWSCTADSAARRSWDRKPPHRRIPGNVTATTIQMTRSVPSPGQKHQTNGPPGTKPSRSSARPASPTSGPSRRAVVAGPRRLRGADRLGTPHAETAAAVPARRLLTRLARSAPTPRPMRPARPATTTAPGVTKPWLPATAPARPLPAARTGPRPGHGRPGGMGSCHRFRPTPGHRRPTPNCAAATPGRESSRSAPGSQRLLVARTRAVGSSPGRQAHRNGAWFRDLAIQREAFRARSTNARGLIAPGQDPVRGDLGETLPTWRASGRDAILQPPSQRSSPQRRILQLAGTAAEPDYEAAD